MPTDTIPDHLPVLAHRLECVMQRAVRDIHGLVPGDEPDRTLNLVSVIVETCARMIQRAESVVYAVSGCDDGELASRVEAIIEDLRDSLSPQSLRDALHRRGGDVVVEAFRELHQRAAATEAAES